VHSNHFLLLLALLIPLTIDTFIVSAALGLAGLHKRRHLRTSLTFAGFEALMPAVGVLIGHGIADFAGQYAHYLAAAAIGIAGLILLWPGNEEKENQKRSKLLSQTRGLAIINLGLSISIDELALGLSLGLLHVPLLLAVVLIGIQAFIASQLGIKLGQKLSQQFREHAEKLAGLFLIAVALIIVGIKLSGHQF
jgi:putative Mn2+ efflux pump MntP